MIQKLLLFTALILVGSAIGFYIWVDRLFVPEPSDTEERFRLFQELRKYKSKREPIPDKWKDAARKLGASPEQTIEKTNPSQKVDEYTAWERALEYPVRIAAERQNLYMYYRERRIPLCTGAIGLAILLGALAFKKPKSPSLSGRS
jgi:hypothetical protein